jgi:hypothetical protein
VFCAERPREKSVVAVRVIGGNRPGGAAVAVSLPHMWNRVQLMLPADEFATELRFDRRFFVVYFKGTPAHFRVVAYE